MISFSALKLKEQTDATSYDTTLFKEVTVIVPRTPTSETSVHRKLLPRSPTIAFRQSKAERAYPHSPTTPLIRHYPSTASRTKHGSFVNKMMPRSPTIARKAQDKTTRAYPFTPVSPLPSMLAVSEEANASTAALKSPASPSKTLFNNHAV
jgi:hypothetical protein